jgi:hypothetical protein
MPCSGILGSAKRQSGFQPFVAFYSTTFLQPCKTCGFAYTGCKNVANLERYMTCPNFLKKCQKLRKTVIFTVEI